MSKWLAGKPQKLAFLLVVSSALGAFGWLWWSAAKRSEINFLPTIAKAKWIIYPYPPQVKDRLSVELNTVFRRSFPLEKISAPAKLHVAGFQNYSVSINGTSLHPPAQRGKTWKEPDIFEIAGLLRTGENQIEVTVSNSNGPPALWLFADIGDGLKSDADWECSYSGATWKKAALAAKPKSAGIGNPMYSPESTWNYFQNRWPTLLLFTLLSCAVYWLFARQRVISLIQTGKTSSVGVGISRTKAFLPVLAFIAFWTILFINNTPVFPRLYGYDVLGHMTYIAYIQEHKSLPLPTEGWEMFQPPLYYILGAALLSSLSLTVSDPAGLVALRTMGLLIGMAHFIVVWASLRLLFPKDTSKHRWGLILAACFPPLLYICQYITNEGLAATLVSASVYLCLCILKKETRSWKLHLGLGLCLGAALLTKSTALLVVPPILGALLWKAFGKRGAKAEGPRLTDSGQIVLAIVTVALTAGWHYGRIWAHFGTPLLGNWDPRSGFYWWQDNGYQTTQYFMRFGKVFSHPWYSALNGFGDGIYSTLWGDAFGASSEVRFRTPWNYDLMAVGYWLALLPTAALLIGGLIALRTFILKPSAEWFLLLGFSFLIVFALLYMSLKVPSYASAKAFYGLSGLIPFCALGACGLQALTAKYRDSFGKGLFDSSILSGLKSAACNILIGLWAINSFASFWISHGSATTATSAARSLARDGKIREAEILLRISSQANPNASAIQASLADLLTVAGDSDEALKLANSAVEENPNDGNRRLTLALALTRKQRTNEAIDEARRAIELAPELSLAYEHMVGLLVQKGQAEEAIRSAREGLAIDPFSFGLRFALGKALLIQNDFPEGTTQMLLACKLQPNNARAHYELALAFDFQHQLTQAIEQYYQALRLVPDFVEALNNLAWIRATNPQEQLRNGSEAVSLAERACQLAAHKEAPLVGTLAAAYAEAGRFDEAVETASKARTLALASGLTELANKNDRLIKLFKDKQPYRDPSIPPEPTDHQ